LSYEYKEGRLPPGLSIAVDVKRHTWWNI
jgi:hypothetical protein